MKHLKTFESFSNDSSLNESIIPAGEIFDKLKDDLIALIHKVMDEFKCSKESAVLSLAHTYDAGVEHGEANGEVGFHKGHEIHHSDYEKSDHPEYSKYAKR